MARILIIDDDQIFRKLVRRMLEDAGHEVMEAKDGNEGMRLFREQGADLLLLDIVMPEKEGLGTLMELRRYHPETPVIVVSGVGALGPVDLLDAARTLGAHRTLAKPFELTELLTAVREEVAKKE